MKRAGSGKPSRWALFLAIAVIGCGLRLGYGIARHHDEFSRTGTDFILLWDFDALEHVLIAKSVIEERAYRVGPDIEGKWIRFGPNEALFKAPLYQYFLAGVFAISGFSFVLFFPLQALIGGIAAGLAALVALDLFGSRRAAVFSGMAAAAHPILVNAASQPYNENLFVALILGSIWAFTRWLATVRMRWAIACGTLCGLAVLCRESAIPLPVAMAGFALVTRPDGTRRSIAASCVVVAVAVSVIAPWTVRNFIRTSEVVPVSAITGTALSIGNNECLARKPLLTWYWAEEACPPLNATRQALMDSLPADRQLDRVARNRINARLGVQFVTERPLDYLRLCAQRAWTILLPFHPRQTRGNVQRVALFTYWLAVIPAGVIATFLRARRPTRPAFLLALLTAVVLAPQVLIYISPDLRHRIAADLLLAALAGSLYSTPTIHRADRTRATPAVHAPLLKSA